MNIRNPNSHKISQLKVRGKLINNPRDISNKLNEYFVNVGPTTEDSIPKTQNVSALKFMKEHCTTCNNTAQPVITLHSL